MNIKDLRSKNTKELHKILAQERNKLRDRRFSVASKQYKNYKELRRCRQDIARILTVLKEQELAARVSSAVNN